MSALTAASRRRKVAAALAAAGRALELLDEINDDARSNPLDYRAGSVAGSVRAGTVAAAGNLDRAVDVLRGISA